MPDDSHMSSYLANERTFLAWVRTSIAVISLGFVVAKFGVWIRELAKQLDPLAPAQGTGRSMPVGVFMMALGGIIAVIAAHHYHTINQAIDKGEPYAGKKLINGVTIAVVFLTLVMIAYLLSESSRI